MLSRARYILAKRDEVSLKLNQVTAVSSFACFVARFYLTQRGKPSLSGCPQPYVLEFVEGGEAQVSAHERGEGCNERHPLDPETNGSIGPMHFGPCHTTCGQQTGMIHHPSGVDQTCEDERVEQPCHQQQKKKKGKKEEKPWLYPRQ